MKVEAIEEISRVPLSVDYRRMYRGRAVISVGDRATPATPIEFVLEMSAWGTHDVSVSFLGSTEYPTIPATNVLKEYIQGLNRAGALP